MVTIFFSVLARNWCNFVSVEQLLDLMEGAEGSGDVVDVDGDDDDADVLMMLCFMVIMMMIPVTLMDLNEI